MEKVKYILFEANFDENETNIYNLCSIDSIEDFFCCNEDSLCQLLKNGVYFGEWYSYHLIKLEDYN